MFFGRAALALISAVSMVLSGCEAADKEHEPPPVSPQWRVLTLPTPPGEPGRLMLREAVHCEDVWYILGAVGSASGQTRPAAWTSRDGDAWTVVSVHPRSYYGERAILYSGACRGDRLAVVGAKVGGAHGNPRVTTWHQLPNGSLDEVLAEFELFGGPQAINVSRMSAGSGGWMITGNRYSGAAVWFSEDSTAFEIKEGVPELSSDARGGTWAVDVAATDEGWIVVGGLLRKGRIDRDPMAWKSVDGSVWRRTAAPSTDDYEEFHRVVVLDGVVFAVGLRGGGFGAWRLTGDEWKQAAAFGGFAPHGIPGVGTLVSLEGNLLAVLTNGVAHELWLSPDASSWVRVQAPMAMAAGAEKNVSVATFGQRVILLIDDGAAGKAWAADMSVTF